MVFLLIAFVKLISVAPCQRAPTKIVPVELLLVCNHCQDDIELLGRTAATWRPGAKTAAARFTGTTYGVTGRWAVGNVAAISINEFQSHLAKTTGET
jgi:Tfp pilus assembly protein PilX